MKAYWIAHVTVTDPEAYKQYQALAPAALDAFGGRFVARGGDSETLEGAEFARHVVLEFPSMQAAQDCYRSEAYQAARKAREGAATVHLVIVEAMPT